MVPNAKPLTSSTAACAGVDDTPTSPATASATIDALRSFI
jgi:hypothetical protein